MCEVVFVQCQAFIMRPRTPGTNRRRVLRIRGVGFVASAPCAKAFYNRRQPSCQGSAHRAPADYTFEHQYAFPIIPGDADGLEAFENEIRARNPHAAFKTVGCDGSWQLQISLQHIFVVTTTPPAKVTIYKHYRSTLNIPMRVTPNFARVCWVRYTCTRVRF